MSLTVKLSTNTNITAAEYPLMRSNAVNCSHFMPREALIALIQKRMEGNKIN